MNLLQKAINRFKTYCLFVVEGCAFVGRQCRYNASIKTKSDAVKSQSVILRLNHTLEKGMTLPNPRPGFGEEKALKLIDLLDAYERRFHDKDFLKQPLQTLGGYIAFSGDTITPQVTEKYSELCKRLSFNDLEAVGVEVLDRDSIQSAAKGDFKSLLESRHSVRDFQQKEVDNTLLEEALRLASRTPSACNRQAWRTHIYKGDKASALLQWQGGCKGFEDKVRTAIVVTAESRAFLEHEQFQAYVDGGLYAMNLINSLHYLGLGTIALSLGFNSKKLKGLSNFGIGHAEVPVVIVAVGYLQQKVRVASSLRRDISQTNSYEN